VDIVLLSVNIIVAYCGLRGMCTVGTSTVPCDYCAAHCGDYVFLCCMCGYCTGTGIVAFCGDSVAQCGYCVV